ncbi:MAG: DedA family protein [Deltaproteobacteria bacterium]|nr:DedA family protein [Deltaproteobacteria bacterium]
MEQVVTDILSGASGAGAYGLVLAVLLACGLGVPLPEDVALITGGFLVYTGAARLEVMIAIAFVGILGGDSFAFMLGRYLGDRLTRAWPFRLIITPAKRGKVEGLFARYGEKIVMAARFMPGVRAVTYFSAGAAGMRYWRFVAFDGIAALVSAPVFVLLGWYFGGKIEWLIGAVRRGQGAVLGLLAAVVAVIIFARYVRRWLADRAAVLRAEAAALAPPPPVLIESPGSIEEPKPKGEVRVTD